MFLKSVISQVSRNTRSTPRALYVPSHEIRSHKFGLYDFCDSRGRELTSKHTADCVKSERKVRVAMIYDIDEKFGSKLANRLPVPQRIDFG